MDGEVEADESYFGGVRKAKRGRGAGKIWFNAAGYSQLAGSFGLRDILNSIGGKNVIIMSHSRGASVALSALSNPQYNPNFKDQTYEYHNFDVYANGAKIKENNNSIYLVMLALAIGDVDILQYK